MGQQTHKCLKWLLVCVALGLALIKGTKFCVYASLAFRVIEFIFKSDYHLKDFLVDITMDVAKVIVSSVVIGIIGGILTVGGAPVVLTALAVIIAGVILNLDLNTLDEKLGISVDLKNKLQQALDSQQKMSQWDYQHLSPFSTPLPGRGY